MSGFEGSLERVAAYAARVTELNALYRAGKVKVHVPRGLHESEASLDDLVVQLLPASHAALQDASQGLFFSLPVAFDPSESVGPYLAAVDRDAAGLPYRFLDLGAQIATHAFGENDPEVVRAVLESLPFVTDRYAHSEYQTTLSLKLKAALSRIAPKGTPRHFIVNTGAESVENAIKSVLLNRVMTTDEKDGGFVVSFEGAFHGRTLGSLAVTHRKKARLGFPTFDWPHIPFPFEEPRSPKATLQREERTLKQLWDLLVSGRLPKAEKSRDTFKREMDALDEFLAKPDPDASAVSAFVTSQRNELTADVLKRAQRTAAVLVEPIQGEGGVRGTTARFMRKLRLLTKIYDVPLVFDEVQTGWGATGRVWAHEHFDLPCPPDVVTWAKKAQNGVLFVSEELATFFQEERKFNTTWEGDSAGMVRLLAKIDALDLDEVCRTGQRAKAGLAALAKDHREIIGNVRGLGVMLAFDVLRPDWSEPLRDRAFRRGLLLLGAGERSIRFYPRYDTEASAIDEALEILRASIEDLVGGRVSPDSTQALRIRVGTLTMPLDTLELVDVTPANFESLQKELLALEAERYDPESRLLKYPASTLEATVRNAKAAGLALRDKVSGRLVGYALGSALEDHDEEGISSDPRAGENDTFYLQALTVPRSAQNASELENWLLDAVREKAIAAGFTYLSTLIEASAKDTGPMWLQEAAVLERIENYLGSGAKFVYLQAPLIGLKA
jgi:4-aminobutyrate aminotransferase/(S)-3-amino-2-methylpropionate transaminase